MELLEKEHGRNQCARIMELDPAEGDPMPIQTFPIEEKTWKDFEDKLGPNLRGCVVFYGRLVTENEAGWIAPRGIRELSIVIPERPLEFAGNLNLIPERPLERKEILDPGGSSSEEEYCSDLTLRQLHQ